LERTEVVGRGKEKKKKKEVQPQLRHSKGEIKEGPTDESRNHLKCATKTQAIDVRNSTRKYAREYLGQAIPARSRSALLKGRRKTNEGFGEISTPEVEAE